MNGVYTLWQRAQSHHQWLLVCVASHFMPSFAAMPAYALCAADVGDRLAREGFVVFGLDHACHGLSAGLHCYIRRFDDLVADVASFIRHIKSEWASAAAA